MKRRIYGVCVFVSYLLVVCLALSVKIDEEMSTEIIIRPVEVTERYTDGLYIISPYCLYVETIETDGIYEGRFILYELAEGSGWQQGLRVVEVPSSQYTITAGGGVDQYVQFTTTKSRTLVRDASRQPVEGQQAVIVEQTVAADQYLIYYPSLVKEYEDPVEGYTLAAKGENVLLMDVAESPTPFLEEQANETLYLSMTYDSRLFSVNDAVAFLRCLPWVALAGMLLLLTLPLWGWILAGLGDGWSWRLTLAALAIGALTWGAMSSLGQFDLPSSLMPVDSVFDLAYYKEEFGMIFQALGQVDPEHGCGIYEAAAYARQWCTTCTAVGGATFLLLALLPLAAKRLHKQPQTAEAAQ